MKVTIKTSACNFLLPFLILAASVVSGKKVQEGSAAQKADQITNLPGQPKVGFRHFSGYITVNQTRGRALFYWFFEAQEKPSQKPLLLWMNGGPGCSSVGYGAAQELGPFRVMANGTGLSLNPFSWNRVANLLFVESPVSVGFSYTNSSSDIHNLTDAFTAGDAYEFLEGWFDRFPEYKTHEFYISGESYAGHYVPQLAELIYDTNQNKSNNSTINLKGFIVGNPVIDEFYDWNGVVDFAWSHAVIGDESYQALKKACKFKQLEWTDECFQSINSLFEQYALIDIYNIYAPRCLLNTSIFSGFKNSKRWINRRFPGGRYDPCFERYTNMFFNRADVQRALHVRPTKWQICSEEVLDVYKSTNFSVIPTFKKLIEAGLRIWVYSGEVDGRIPVTSTKNSLKAMHLPVKRQWQAWFYDQQVGGRFQEYQGLTHVSVRGAGHMVPLNKPREALSMIKTFLSNQTLRDQY